MHLTGGTTHSVLPSTSRAVGASIWGEHVFKAFSHAKHVVKPQDGAFAGSIWGAGPYIPPVPKEAEAPVLIVGGGSAEALQRVESTGPYQQPVIAPLAAISSHPQQPSHRILNYPLQRQPIG